MSYTFDKNYENHEQVIDFYGAFKKLKSEIEAQGKYPSNSQFEGRITGIAGNDEKTAIYLLQQLDTDKTIQKKIDNLLESGYTEVTPEEGGSIRYESIVKVGNDHSRAGTDEYPKARLFFADKRMFIVPKGNRTRGYCVFPDSRVYVK